MKRHFASFRERSERTRYIHETFKPYLEHSVLDVGCDRALLRDLLPGVEYLGVDMGGTPDMTINLEQVERLPFDDCSFHTIVCSDVLEHLDNLHAMFDELVRVSGKYLVLSLPNCWCVARRPIERGKGSFTHYGLPAEKPVDRHKWFFSASEAVNFFEAEAKKHDMKILDVHSTEKPRLSLVRGLRRLRYPNVEHYVNRYAHTVWVVLEKK